MAVWGRSSVSGTLREYTDWGRPTTVSVDLPSARIASACVCLALTDARRTGALGGQAHHCAGVFFF